MVVRGAAWVLAVLAWACAGCAARGPLVAEVPSLPLVGQHDETLDARALVRSAPLTVLVFFSADCHILALHEPRLRALFDAYHPRGVQFLMIDSEVRASAERDVAEAGRRGYPFPILLDRGAKLADALGAEYATYAVVLDAGARVRYHGGIDTDRAHLRDDATPFLRDAIEDLLANREPRVTESKTLGCALQKW
jgi:hypothetical protein